MSHDAIPGYSGPAAEIAPGVFIAERPGGGGRSHRTTRRDRDLAAAHAAGVRIIISGMRSRHALADYARQGFGVRWYPLEDVVQARVGVRELAENVASVIGRDPGAVLLHVDRWSEWDAALAAAVLLRLDMAPDAAAALEIAESHGLPVGDMARAIIAA